MLQILSSIKDEYYLARVAKEILNTRLQHLSFYFDVCTDK